MRDAVNSAKTESNTVKAWWEDGELTVKTTADTLKMDVYRSYSGWCKANGLPSVPMPKFWKRLTATVKGVIETRMTTTAGRPRVCNVDPATLLNPSGPGWASPAMAHTLTR